VPVAAAGAWIGYSALAIDHRVSLPDAIVAERSPFPTKAAGWLSAYVDRAAAGRPLVLIHSVNAAASAYEMGPLFRHYRSRRPVFALDLPGYGFSNRLKRTYTPELFADAIAEFLETQVGEPADVAALSLGCEFAARAALQRPDLVRTLAFISPSGLNRSGSGRATQQATASGTDSTVHSLLAFPLWGRPLFDLVASRRSIEFFLSKSFVGPITPGYVDYCYATAHQPGAEHAPLYFLSGRLFTRNAFEELYQKLPMPTLAIYDRDFYVNFERLPEVLERNMAWKSVRISPTLGLPQFEKLDAVTAELDAFWQSVGA